MTDYDPSQLSKDGRSEFGYSRTVCGCQSCTINCRFMPGYLIPADLERLRQRFGFETQWAFAFSYLLASPGALVVKGGREFRIRTLVPRRANLLSEEQGNGCIFLDKDGRCSIHEISPFGCAFFDAHMPPFKYQPRTQAGLVAVQQAWEDDAEYARIWCKLDRLGRRAPLPERSIKLMRKRALIEGIP